MSKGSDGFMLEEYKQITQAFLALHMQKNHLLKYYLTLMTIGTTSISIGSQLLPSIFPEVKPFLNAQLLGSLLVFLAIVGVIIFISIIGVRHDMILYAKTINEIRGYFAKKYKFIEDHLVLPTDSSKPRFFSFSLNISSGKSH